MLRESDVAQRSLEFVDKAVRKHRGLVKNIRRTFEILRGEEKSLKKQPHGDEVDMSGSTKGWIKHAEREALLLLCEAPNPLGDRYAIYGFSGMTRKGRGHHYGHRARCACRKEFARVLPQKACGGGSPPYGHVAGERFRIVATALRA